MSIDRADWHRDSAEKLYREKNNCIGALTDEQQWEIWLKAANHIGLFLWWIIDRRFEGENLAPEDCAMVRNGQMTGTEFFMRYCDGKLWNDDICEDILPFVNAYYLNDGAYLDDYCECCLDEAEKPLYEVISGKLDYEKLRKKIDSAYRTFLTK